MPIYEFYSPDTHRIYAFLARSVGLSDRVPRCPDGPEFRMRRVASRFAFVGRARDPIAEGGGHPDPDDPRLEAAMAEMEREFAGIDEDNPDPRQLGRMMRRMTELTGEAMPGAFDEMVARLEKGEDPEKLEEEYAEVLDDTSLMEGEDAGEAGEGRARRLRALVRRGAPSRDPALYEMRHYLDD